ncbi:protein of unknown function [Burkholderia multivorans]
MHAVSEWNASTPTNYRNNRSTIHSCNVFHRILHL